VAPRLPLENLKPLLVFVASLSAPVLGAGSLAAQTTATLHVTATVVSVSTSQDGLEASLATAEFVAERLARDAAVAPRELRREAAGAAIVAEVLSETRRSEAVGVDAPIKDEPVSLRVTLHYAAN
jgi:hypothetical protein